jgi:hypothetical protein
MMARVLRRSRVVESRNEAPTISVRFGENERLRKDLDFDRVFLRHAATTAIYTPPSDDEMQQRVRGLRC